MKSFGFLWNKWLFFKSQYGFRKQHSTVQHAILDIISTVQSNMDKGFYTCSIFIDLKKLLTI